MGCLSWFFIQGFVPRIPRSLHVPPMIIMHHGPRTAPRKAVQQGGSTAAPVVSGGEVCQAPGRNSLPIRVTTLWVLRSNHLASHDPSHHRSRPVHLMAQ